MFKNNKPIACNHKEHFSNGDYLKKKNLKVGNRKPRELGAMPVLVSRDSEVAHLLLFSFRSIPTVAR